MVSRFATNGPVKQEGILFQQPQFRMMPPQRTDILVTPPGYVPSHTNQPGNQGPSIRGIAPSGPPNQASTPPNAEQIKVQQLPTQSMSPMFIPRTTQGFYPTRTSGPSSQAQRMPNHNRSQPQVYGQTAQFMMPTPTFIPMPANVTYYNTPQRPQNFVQSTIPMYSGPPITYPHYSVNPNPSQAQVPFFFNHAPMIQRGTSIQQPQQSTPNPTQTAISSGPPLAKPPTQVSSFQQQRSQNRTRRPNAIAIIDPKTGEDKLAEMFEGDSSHPASGESSARETPQPNSSNNTHKQEVQASFAKMVFQALQSDIPASTKVVSEDGPSERLHTDSSPLPYNIPPPQQVPQQQTVLQHNTSSNKMEHIVQSSKLQPMAKEFEPPVVSANCDAVEVTLPNKLPKDRESPVKRSKPKEQPSTPREHKDTKDSSSKDTISDASIVKVQEVKPKEVSSSNTTNLSPAPALSKDNIKDNNQNQEKRSQRQDSKSENTNVPSIDAKEVVVPTSTIQTSQAPQDPNSNGKSKQNASRSNAKQIQPPVQQHQPQVATTIQNANFKQQASVSVPQSQPAKPSNKSHKKNELNQKGASKEGTDMDAFNDNVAAQEVNANVTSMNDIINANSVPLKQNNNVLSAKDVNVNIDTSKTLDNNDLTIRSEPTKTKPKVDITDIVRDIPKPIIKRSIDSHDETDRSLGISNEKSLIQSKNEINAKTSDGVDNKLPYKEGQWTPNNPNGCKVYDKSFLMALQNAPSSRIRPENIPDFVLADERGRLPDRRLSMGGRADMANSSYNNFGGKSGSQRGVPPSSSKSKLNDRRKPPSIQLSLSVREDVKLRESDNAWRPAKFVKGENATDEDKKTEELYRRVRGVLNKLTPQKFDTLLFQIKSLNIDTAARLQGVIDLVFEKAVDEPNFSVAYASMCSELALIQVPSANDSEKTDGLNFRKLLINRCQLEFEKQSRDESARKSKVKEIEDCTDPEKKKDLLFDLEECNRRLRMKSVGNIRFIGELFKQNMLTVNIMIKCLKKLLDNKDEESLECLCKLLTTIGKELESKAVDISQIYSSMKMIADNKSGKVSSRIRFMLQDVIDLKRSKWVSRRQDHNPKTIDQIQKEADQEQLNIQMMNLAPMAPRRDDRMNTLGSGQNTLDRKGNRNNRNNSSDTDGWTTNNRNRTSFNVQSEKLKNKAPLIDEPFGSPQLFGSWGKGSVGSSMKSQQQQSTYTSNIYAALDNIETDRRSLGQRQSGRDPYSSKGPSLERSYNKYDGRGSRSGSQHRSNDSLSSQRSMPPPPPPVAKPPPPAANPPQSAPAKLSEVLTEEQLERRIGISLDEYINENCSLDEFYTDVSSVTPVTFYAKMVGFMYLRVLEKSQLARLKMGGLFGKLVKAGKISVEDYCTGLEEILSQGDDLVIDIPKIWDYLGEITIDLICEEALTLDKLKESLSLLGATNSEKVLSHLSTLLADRNMSYLMDATAGMPYSLIEDKLLDLFKSNADLDTVVKWITDNVGDNKNEYQFIRALATAIFRDSIDPNMKLSKDRLSNHVNLLTKYVDNNAEFELQCLFALQALIHKLEHPQGLLLAICNRLYELSAFSQESFIAWEENNDTAEQEGKGVALKQLVSFFTQLKEIEDEESDDSEGN